MQELTSLPDQLDEAVTYIKKLQISLEKMKEKKNSLMGTERTTYSHYSNAGSFSNSRGAIMSLKSPHIEIHEMGSALEVVLITGLDCQFMFNETIRVLHEEGADIVNASFSAAEDTIFHTIHCQVIKYIISYLPIYNIQMSFIVLHIWCHVYAVM